MTKPNSPEPLKDEQTTRFRNILKGDEDEAPARPPEPSTSVLDRIPRAVEFCTSSSQVTRGAPPGCQTISRG